MVDIPLVNLSVDGEEWEQWYALEPFGKLRAGGRLGSIHLKLKIGACVDSRAISTRRLADVDRGPDDVGDEEQEFADQPPNFLKVTLHRVRVLVVLREAQGGGVLIVGSPWTLVKYRGTLVGYCTG